VQNQLGRRNLTDFVKTELALIAKPIIEAMARAQQSAVGGDRRSEQAQPLRPNSDEAIRTDVEVGKMAGVGKDTVRKVEVIKASAAPELLGAVRAGEVSIHAAAEIATLPPERFARARVGASLSLRTCISMCRFARARVGANGSGRQSLEHSASRSRQEVADFRHDMNVTSRIDDRHHQRRISARCGEQKLKRHANLIAGRQCRIDRLLFGFWHRSHPRQRQPFDSGAVLPDSSSEFVVQRHDSCASDGFFSHGEPHIKSR